MLRRESWQRLDASAVSPARMRRRTAPPSPAPLTLHLTHFIALPAMPAWRAGTWAHPGTPALPMCSFPNTRKEFEDAWDDSDRGSAAPAFGGLAELAVQPRLGLLPFRNAWSGSGDCAGPGLDGSRLTGALRIPR